MRRREFISLLGGAAASCPLAARAQQPAVPVVGYLAPGTPEGSAASLEAFRNGLAEAGFVEGGNVTLDIRWMYNDFSRLPELTADLLRQRPAVLFTGTPPGLRAALAATKTIPIVFNVGEDPVKEGLVASLNRPGGNVTGFSDFANQLAGKRLGLLHDVVPKAISIAFLVDANNPNAEPDTKDMKAAAATRRIELPVFPIRDDSDLERAFAAMSEQRVNALIVNTAPRFLGRVAQIVALSNRYAIATLYDRKEFTRTGGLLSYGPDRLASARQAAAYVGRILKGEKPADLPVQQTTKLEFVINLKAVKTFGLDIPPGVLALADEVIE
jgi:putative tryptophan/tyrosine transport system substrate-binding protein